MTMHTATPNSIITAIKGLVEDGKLPDTYHYLMSQYAEVDFARDDELNGLVVSASMEDPEGGVELALVRRQSRVIYAEANLTGMTPKAAALVVVSMLAMIDEL